MRGLILSGGLGSRMASATLHQNKHLLPVYSSQGATPMIYYPVSTLVRSGITDILVISSREHCGRIMETLSDGVDFGVDFTYKIQDTAHVPLGIASALKLAKNFTADQRFAVILGDNYFEDDFKEDVKEFETTNADAFLFLKEVEDVHRFGCATINKDGTIEKIIEKPKNPESNWAVTGIYFYTPHVYEIAETLKLSGRGELEITDINDFYCQKKTAKAKFVSNYWSDMGTPNSMIRTQDYIWDSSHSRLTMEKQKTLR